MKDRELIETFCRQVRARSVENGRAVEVLHRAGVAGQVVSVLRQELDSMVRVIFLLSQRSRVERLRLMLASVEGRRWTEKASGKPISDRQMVELANRLQGWTKSVYLFGCAFIHLSRFHDYLHRDPLAALSPQERQSVLSHLRAYHGGPSRHEPTFADVVPLLPNVFHKIEGNLDCYLRELEGESANRASGA